MGVSIILFNFDSIPMAPSSRWLARSLATGCVGEFAHVSRAFVFLAQTLASLETINVLLALHLLNTNFPYSDSLLDFQPNSNLELFVDIFRSTFLCISHLLIGGPLSMVFKHF
jgi:hypothetical protein